MSRAPIKCWQRFKCFENHEKNEIKINSKNIQRIEQCACDWTKQNYKIPNRLLCKTRARTARVCAKFRCGISFSFFPRLEFAVSVIFMISHEIGWLIRWLPRMLITYSRDWWIQKHWQNWFCKTAHTHPQFHIQPGRVPVLILQKKSRRPTRRIPPGRLAWDVFFFSIKFNE